MVVISIPATLRSGTGAADRPAGASAYIAGMILGAPSVDTTQERIAASGGPGADFRGQHAREARQVLRCVGMAGAGGDTPGHAARFTTHAPAASFEPFKI
ncbi:hypothetical protein GCM10027426_24420 [Microbacterium lacusdiani]